MQPLTLGDGPRSGTHTTPHDHSKSLSRMRSVPDTRRREPCSRVGLGAAVPGEALWRRRDPSAKLLRKPRS